MVQIDDSVDQPRRKRRFLDRSLAGALLVSIGVDEHAIDGLGLHRLQRIGDDPGQAFSLQFGSSIPGQLVGGFEGEPNPSGCGISANPARRSGTGASLIVGGSAVRRIFLGLPFSRIGR